MKLEAIEREARRLSQPERAWLVLALVGTLGAGGLFPTVTGLAQPARYTFSGQVTSLDHDGAGILAAQRVAIGDPVSVIFDVDFGLPGGAVLNDGSMEVLQPYVWDDLRIDYFHTRLVSGTLFPEVNGGMYNGPEDVREYLAGWNRTDGTGNQGVLKGGGSDSYFALERRDPAPGAGVPNWRVQDWQVGTAVRGTIVGMSELDYSMVRADLRLDSITVVPEPSVVSLLLMGGTVCVLWGRRGANKSGETDHGSAQPSDFSRDSHCDEGSLNASPAAVPECGRYLHRK